MEETSLVTLIPHSPLKKVGQKIESLIRKALYEYSMLENVSDLAIALSGGKDSLTLLFMLKAISGKGIPPINIHAIHVQGEFSCGAGVNSNFLQKTCCDLNIPLHLCTSTQTKESLECYSCSRERRRLIFEQAKSVGATTIAFGHHRDDNAQTLLMNLFHKGEFAGLLPKIEMVDYGVTIIRPLIYASEENILTFAKDKGFARITCQCPVGINSMRKKVDHLLNEWKDLFPNIRTNISQASLVYGSAKAQKGKL